jgi:hypothetical protein
MVDRRKLEFLFGARAEGMDDADLGDEDLVAELLGEDQVDAGPEAGPRGRAFAALRHVVANQILAGDPPEVWDAAERCIAAGVDRRSALAQLQLVLLVPMRAVAEDGTEFDLGQYRESLSCLPYPTYAEVFEQLVAEVATNRGITADALVDAVAGRFGRTGDPAFTEMVEHGLDHLIIHERLEMLAPDVIVDAGRMTTGIVLTHRLTEFEVTTGMLDASFDLPTLARPDVLRSGADELTRVELVPAHLGVVGPPDWLDDLAAGQVVAVRVDADGAVTLSPCDPAPSPALVTLVGEVLDAEHAEPGLPVSAEELVLGVLVRDPDEWTQPRPPLSELVTAHGWMIRAGEAGPSEAAWDLAATLRAFGRLEQEMPDRDVTVAVAALAADADDDALRAFVDELVDPVLAVAFARELSREPELVGPFREAYPERPLPAEWVEARADRMIASATHGVTRANARLVAALLAERRHEPLVAEAHLELAYEADRHNAVVVDRLAWCKADRGEAAEAVRLWRTLDPDGPHEADLREAAEFVRGDGRALGRNEACWCGSGRKFKQCHLGRPAPRPLVDRVPWLMRKAVAYLERRGPLADDVVFELASVLADDDEELIDEVLQSPVPIDLALTEGGWFEEFLADRSALLPDDEAMLARTWAGIDRSVFEVETVNPGVDLSLRDLRTGEVTVVQERTFSRTARPRQLVCARVVPDGEGHQLIGAVLQVRVGTERALLERLDERDHYVLAEWWAAELRPPTVRLGSTGELIDGRDLLDLAGGVVDAAPDVHRGPMIDLTEAERAEIGAEFIEGYERDWCDTSVPALGGLTPRQAADDPTRREQLERLLAEFDARSGVMRADRLRALLDL